MNATRSLPIKLSFACLFILCIKPAHAEVTPIASEWNRSVWHWCGSIFDTFPPPQIQVAYYGEPDGSRPQVGEVYKVRVVVVTPDCGDENAVFRIQLPPDTEFAIANEAPIECGYYFANEQPPKPVNLPPEQCATSNPRRFLGGGLVHDFTGVQWDIEPAGREEHWFKRGAVNVIMMPFVSRKPLRKQDAAFRVWVQHKEDTQGGDYKATTVQIAVAPGPGGAPAGVGPTGPSLPLTPRGGSAARASCGSVGVCLRAEACHECQKKPKRREGQPFRTWYGFSSPSRRLSQRC
jgi:hypothetical protein